MSDDTGLLEHALARCRAEGMTVAQIETLEQNAIGRRLFRRTTRKDQRTANQQAR